jgi:hypothetical protein
MLVCANVLSPYHTSGEDALLMMPHVMSVQSVDFAEMLLLKVTI